MDDGEPERLRIRSLYIGRPAELNKDGPTPRESQDETNDDADAKGYQPKPARMTINLGSLDEATQRTHLRASHSVPEKLHGYPSPRSSFRQPITSASDECVVGRRMTMRKPVFLTGYLDATSFPIGGTISFRLIINNMHKRPGITFTSLNQEATWANVLNAIIEK